MEAFAIGFFTESFLKGNIENSDCSKARKAH